MRAFDVAVFRFTPHVAAHRALLEVLGLRAELESDRGHYVELRGARGRVHVHEAARPVTELHLFCPSLTAAHERLAEAGVEAELWDEAFGKMMRVPGPGDATVLVVEAQQDPYGYTALDAAGARGDVAAVWYTHDMAREARGFRPYGFAPAGPLDEWWTELRAASDGGAIGLHRAGADQPGSAATGECELTVTVDDDLHEVAARLERAGHTVTRFRDEFISYVGVTDPDGHQLQVHGTFGG